MTDHFDDSLDDARKVWSVTELNAAIRDLVNPEFDSVWLEGEISGFKRNASGHFYFELKDGGSRIPATIWASSASRIKLRLDDGMKVLCRGRVDVWVPGGRYSFIVTSVQAAGEGALWAAYAKLKAKLEAEGVLGGRAEEELPFLPKAVGLVTSPTGAALRDMLRILHERFPVRVILAPAKVQGDGAAESIASAIEALDTSGLVDVIIAGRGGGSIEELWCFNEERVVRAFATCRTPIVSAVGHETDTLLSDLAASWRAPTPTAAAKRVVPDIQELSAGIGDASERVARATTQRIQHLRVRVERDKARLARPGELLDQRRMTLDDLTSRLASAIFGALRRKRRDVVVVREDVLRAHPARRLRMLRARHASLALRLRDAEVRLLPERRARLERLRAALGALSPRAALARGFAFVRDAASGRLITDASLVGAGERLEVTLHRGSLDVEVVRTHAEEAP